MRLFTESLVAAGLATMLGVASAPGALAKAHDQGQTETPGESVQGETVGPAQGLGEARGNSGNTPAAEASSSGDASNSGQGNGSGSSSSSGSGAAGADGS